MLSLIIGDGNKAVVDNAMVPVRWCVTPEDFAHINKSGDSPHIVLSVIHEEPASGDFTVKEVEMTRVIVPFSDGMAYVPINRPGEASIRATVIVFRNLSPRSIRSTVKNLSHKSRANRFSEDIHDSKLMYITGKFDFDFSRSHYHLGHHIIDVGNPNQISSVSTAEEVTPNQLRAFFYMEYLYTAEMHAEREAEAAEYAAEKAAHTEKTRIEAEMFAVASGHDPATVEIEDDGDEYQDDDTPPRLSAPIDPSKVYEDWGLRDTGIDTCMSRVTITTPPELFAKPLPGWIERIVTNGYRSKPEDQCEIRQRVLRALVWDMWAVLATSLFTFIVRFVLATLISVGTMHRGVRWSLVFAPHRGSNDDMMDNVEFGNTFAGKFESPLFLPFTPVMLFVASVCSYVIAQKFTSIVMIVIPFMALVVSMLILYLIVRDGGPLARVFRFIHNSFDSWLNARIKTAYESDYDNVVCRGNPLDMVASMDKIPKKNIRLMYADFKAKVCKPTAL